MNSIQWRLVTFFKGEEGDDFYSRNILLFLFENLAALETILPECYKSLHIRINN